MPVETQVPPFGIEVFYEGFFLFSPPGLDLFFSVDGFADIRVLLKVHQAIEPVLASEAWDQFVLVLIIATLDIIRDPNVQGSRASCHDVDPIALHRTIQSNRFALIPRRLRWRCGSLGMTNCQHVLNHRAGDVRPQRLI
jgi:hypothetical protein